MLNSFVRNAGKNLAERVQAIITNQSILEDCVVKVVKENGEENSTYTTKGPEVTLRDI